MRVFTDGALPGTRIQWLHQSRDWFPARGSFINPMEQQMNNVTNTVGFLVVMVDWNNGSTVPVAYAETQTEAESIARETHLTDDDAIVYVMQTTAYAR